ncbi:MAG: NAD(P)/FAD-dependent oxidoreductase [Acidobacteriaceae bacterium]
MPIIVIGAGLSGLSAARELQRCGREVLVLEASDAPGGRVRTDLVNGFRLDRGFQILLTAYPECRRSFDYASLNLRRFKPGALVWFNGRFHRLIDPLRHPLEAIFSTVDPFLSIPDKLRVAKLVAYTRANTIEQIFAAPESSTLQRLNDLNFSTDIIERFFRPFFSGVFLEAELATSSRLFEFYFKMFSAGAAAVPALGMAELSNQLAQGLNVRYNEPVAEVISGDPTRVRLDSGEILEAEQLVIATNDTLRNTPSGDRVSLGEHYPGGSVWNGTACFHYSADRAPLREPILMLNGEGPAAGPVNNCVVMSNVAPELAPAGKHLITASLVGVFDNDELTRLEPRVRQHLRKWFGIEVTTWELLRAYNIPYALPFQPHVDVTVPLRAGIVLAGDRCQSGSLNGALKSGRQAAEALLNAN